MKKIIVAGVAALALAGCATAQPTPVVTVTQLPPPPTEVPSPEPVTAEEQFVEVVEDKYGPLTNNQEQKLIDFAKDTCQNFEYFGVNKTIKMYAQELSSTREAKLAGFVIGAGTALFCPRFNGSFTQGTSA